MKHFRILLVSWLVASSSILAKDTRLPIVEAENGDRLIAITESFTVQKNDNDVTVASIITYWASKPEHKIMWAIDISSCPNSGGEMIAKNLTTDSQIIKYFWHIDGQRIYDGVARSMCSAILKAIQEQNEESLGPTT